MADDKKSKDTADIDLAGPSPSSSRSPLVVILLIFNIVVMGAVAVMQYMAMKRESARTSVADIVRASEGGEVKAEKESGGHGGGGGHGAPAEAAKVEEVKTNGLLFPLDAFTANLAQGDGPRRYLRTSIVLKFSDDSKEAEFKSRSPQIRDTVISILNSKRPEDLLKKEGKSYLKEEIKSAINAFLVDGKVIDVFYVSFQIN